MPGSWLPDQSSPDKRLHTGGTCGLRRICRRCCVGKSAARASARTRRNQAGTAMP
ncbi:hypothetical protein KCP70_02755 [Salmonella enterica subsp. enterica]|nr:hypothetical protein KCP70_02755 [Salmonella enterica subsp. enterica]